MTQSKAIYRLAERLCKLHDGLDIMHAEGIAMFLEAERMMGRMFAYIGVCEPMFNSNGKNDNWEDTAMFHDLEEKKQTWFPYAAGLATLIDFVSDDKGEVSFGQGVSNFISDNRETLIAGVIFLVMMLAVAASIAGGVS